MNNEYQWHDIKIEMPKKDGQYLCAVNGIGSYKYIEICSYANNLESVDYYNFYNKKRVGWYNYDSEWGYVENSGVTHWAELPELPRE